MNNPGLARGGARANAESAAHGMRSDVLYLLSDGGWWTLAELADELDAGEATVGARVRDLRKQQFGGHVIRTRRAGNETRYQLRSEA